MLSFLCYFVVKYLKREVLFSFMVRFFNKLYLVILVVSLLLISGCSTRYVCYDGSVERDADLCPIVELPTVIQRQAEHSIDVYASAYAQALGSRHHRVNTYRDGPNWVSQLLFTNIVSQDVHHVTLSVDGRTASVSCIEGCDYFNKPEVENLTGEIQGNVSNFTNSY